MAYFQIYFWPFQRLMLVVLIEVVALAWMIGQLRLDLLLHLVYQMLVLARVAA